MDSLPEILEKASSAAGAVFAATTDRRAHRKVQGKISSMQASNVRDENCRIRSSGAMANATTAQRTKTSSALLLDQNTLGSAGGARGEYGIGEI